MRRVLTIGFLLLWATVLWGQEPDSAAIQERLDSTVFTSESHTSILEIAPTRPIYINTDLLRRIPSITGTPDPIRIVKLLPGVQTGAEFDAGLHILGTENSHSLVSVDGAPIYGATHVLGLFSTFIPSHYGGMSFAPYDSGANRLGGTVDMKLPDRIPGRIRGQISASLFEAEGTLDIPTGRNSALFLSLRRSYINLLYGSFWADFMIGGDDIKFRSSRGGYSFGLEWMNIKGSLHHRHKWSWGDLHQVLYYTRLNLAVDLEHDIYDMYLPSIIGTLGYSSTLNAGQWLGEVRVEGHHSNPQQTQVRNKDISQAAPDESQAAVEASARVQYSWPITSNFGLAASLFS